MWANLAETGRAPDEHAESSDARTRMSAALASLPREQSRALVLAAVYGYTAAEVSKAEAVPLGTAKSRIRTGLLKLRAVVPQHDFAGGGAMP
jgi:RNA polymerase sigma-70 factor (ECF subfamily)